MESKPTYSLPPKPSWGCIMPNHVLRAKTPSTIANLGPLFDLAALAIDYTHSEITLQLLGETTTKITVRGGTPELQRLAYHTAYFMLEEIGEQATIIITIEKTPPVLGGLGGGGPLASAVAKTINRLLGDVFSELELIQIAGRAQALVAGEPHYDTAAASLKGGLVVLDGRPPRDAASYNPPSWLKLVLFIPCKDLQEALSIREMRKIVPQEIELKKALDWMATAIKLVSKLQKEDWTGALTTISNGGPIEEARAKHIPGYYSAKKTALNSGALGFNISGAGPVLFALTREEDAERIREETTRVLHSYWGCVKTIVTQPSRIGVQVAEIS